jgi:hypothetical protein
MVENLYSSEQPVNVTISIACRNLPSTDYLSKSNPICNVYLFNTNLNHFEFLGQTECITHDNDPAFTRQFTVPYYFEKMQLMKFEIYCANHK